MTAEVVPVAKLSTCSDEEFDKHVKEMSLKTLMESISSLQKDMAREQENFNSLNSQLQTMKSRNSSQYKSISKDMVASQSRLTLLMNRSMKCFAQQNLQQGKQQGPVQLRRRSSAKGEQPSPSKSPNSSTNVQRSKSMYIPPQPDPDPPATRIIKAGSSAFINHTPNTSKPYTPVIANGILNARAPTGVKISVQDKVKVQGQIPNTTKPVIASVKTDTTDNSRTQTGVKISGKDEVRVQGHVQNTTKPVINSVKTDYTDSSQSNKSAVNSLKEDLQVLPSVRQLAKNFGVAPKSNETNFRTGKPTLVRLRSSESMRIERPVSDGFMLSSKQKGEPLVNGTTSEQTASGRHVVSTVLKFDPSPKYRSTENLVDLSSSRPRTNSIPRNITVTSTSREATPARPATSSVVTTVSSKSNGSVTNDSFPKPKSTITVKTETVKNKIDYNPFPGKDALMHEIVSRRKDNDVESTKIEVNESVLKSQPVDEPQHDSEVKRNSNELKNSDQGKQRVVTTKVFVPGNDNSVPNTRETVTTNHRKEDIVPNDDKRTSVSLVTKRNVSQGPPEKPARKSRPDSQNLVDAGGTVNGNDKVKGNPSERVKLLDQEDDEVTPRINLRNWDPSMLLQELYKTQLMDDNAEDISNQFVSMEGYMEKLPMNKKKSTLLKTWKRRFFKASNGWLYYYEMYDPSSNRDKPSDTVQLMGGRIDDMSNRILGIDDGRGKFLMVRCPTEREHGQWKLALESQTADNTRANYIRPVLRANPHPQKKVVVIDLGSTSIRAGILGDQASLPSLFFPSVVAVHKTKEQLVVGADAYRPDVRHDSVLVHPISPSNKVDKDHYVQPFNIDDKQMPAVFEKVFKDLGVQPSQYLVMISTPQSLGDNLRKSLMELLVSRFQVAGVCMVQQSLLALYSYNATSGIIVDIGERIEILPIFDGVLIEGGTARLPYGAQKIQDTLHLSLQANNYQFSSVVEKLLVRYVMEKSCFVSQDYKEDLRRCTSSAQAVRAGVDTSRFDLPQEAYKIVSHDESRFKSPEGLFDTDMWEMDFPKLHKLVFQAIQTCPMECRRRMFRSVYLSGGVTMMPGFGDRLQNELRKLAPPSVPVEVHAAPQRYHAAYVGACAVAGMKEFEHMCITREEWHSHGVKAFKKWNAPSC